MELHGRLAAMHQAGAARRSLRAQGALPKDFWPFRPHLELLRLPGYDPIKTCADFLINEFPIKWRLNCPSNTALFFGFRSLNVFPWPSKYNAGQKQRGSHWCSFKPEFDCVMLGWAIPNHCFK